VEIQQAKEELKNIEPWRKRGPVGKLHNAVKYITFTGQRQQLFEKIQGIEIASLSEDDPAKKIYKLVEDQETCWNPSYDMVERAIILRTSIDEFIRKIIKEYDYRSNCQHLDCLIKESRWGGSLIYTSNIFLQHSSVRYKYFPSRRLFIVHQLRLPPLGLFISRAISYPHIFISKGKSSFNVSPWFDC
jgi:hypothetical protein